MFFPKKTRTLIPLSSSVRLAKSTVSCGFELFMFHFYFYYYNIYTFFVLFFVQCNVNIMMIQNSLVICLFEVFLWNWRRWTLNLKKYHLNLFQGLWITNDLFNLFWHRSKFHFKLIITSGVTIYLSYYGFAIKTFLELSQYQRAEPSAELPIWTV